MDSPVAANAFSSPASAVQFLTFDEQHKLCYGGYCKLGIHGAGKCLTIEPLGEDCKPITAYFKWKFVRQKNLLHIFSDNKANDLILVFANEAVCEKLLLGVSKYFPHITSTEKLYQHELLIPFFCQLFNPDIMRIAKNLIQSFNYKEKEKLIIFIKDNGLYDTVYSCLLPDDNDSKSPEISQNQEPLSELTENYIDDEENDDNHNHITPQRQRTKKPSRSSGTSPFKKRRISTSSSSRSLRGRGRPKKEDDTEVEDNKLIHKRLYARAYREQHQKAVKDYQQCAMDFYNALVANGVNVKQQFPQHAKLIQSLTEKTPGKSGKS